MRRTVETEVLREEDEAMEEEKSMPESITPHLATCKRKEVFPCSRILNTRKRKKRLSL